MLTVHLFGGASTVAYASRNHQPARFTIPNIVVPDLPTSRAPSPTSPAAETHSSATKEHPSSPTRTAPYRTSGPWFVWFTDPAGNVLALCGRDLRTPDNN